MIHHGRNDGRGRPSDMTQEADKTKKFVTKAYPIKTLKGQPENLIFNK